MGYGFSSTIKLGRPRYEIEFTVNEEPESFEITPNTIRNMNENLVGELFQRVRRRDRPKYKFSVRAIGDPLRQKLEGLKRITDTPLSLLFANSNSVYSDSVALESANTFYLPSDSHILLGQMYAAAGASFADVVGIAGVFTTYSADGSQSGTNYATGCTIDPTTLLVTLATSPGAAGTTLFVNWTYKGALVYLNPNSPKWVFVACNADGPLWNTTFELEGA